MDGYLIIIIFGNIIQNKSLKYNYIINNNYFVTRNLILKQNHFIISNICTSKYYFTENTKWFSLLTCFVNLLKFNIIKYSIRSGT